MYDGLPPDFDAAWYAATYPDVAMSGLDPREHYRRFGSLLGRKYKGSPPAPQPAEPATEPAAKTTEPSRAPAAEAAKAAAPPPPPPSPPPPSSPQPKRQKAPAIIERPKGFDPDAAVPQPALPRRDDSAGPFSLDNLPTPGLNDGNRFAVEPALHAYARLLKIKAATGADDGSTLGCQPRAFQSGGTRIENAWLAERARLRLMLAGGADSAGSSFRAYQANPGRPAELRMLGQGVQLPLLGPVLHELELLHPLMPLLLELTDADAATRAFALLPFPSLLPGGLHGAELKALQTEPDPMDDFWALSDALLQETVGGQNWPARSVAAISVSGKSASSNHPVAQVAVQEWLAAVFGLGDRKAVEQGVELVVPPDSVPTISALVSRRLDPGEGAALSGPYLVAEADSHRPRWAIALPADTDAGSAVPLLQQIGAGAAPAAEIAPIPLAIALRSPMAGRSAGSGTKAPSASLGPLTVLVHACDSARVERLIQSLGSAVSGEIEWLVRLDGPGAELSAALDRACGSGAWAKVAANSDVRDVARDARHETLVTISDRIQLGDGRSLFAVLDLLQRDETIGSASCALLAEKIVKKEVVLQPASGGLFPTGVSFVGGPRLSFGEPDALQALPDLTYPVAANTMHFTAWRRRALTELPPIPGTGRARAEDIRLGLDLMRAGYRNWCTTSVTAPLAGAYVRRDAIDPVGAGYLQPERWQEILGKVTVVRELF